MKKIYILVAVLLCNPIFCLHKLNNQEKKPLLSTNKSDISVLMPNLYNYALEFIFSDDDEADKYRFSKLFKELNQNKYYLTISSEDTGIHVVNMINEMNGARAQGYNEKIMAQYAYNMQLKSAFIDADLITILFSLLEKYRLAAEISKELLPFQNNTQTLIQIINNRDNLKRDKKVNMHFTYAQQYPAFCALINDLYYVISLNSETIAAITSYLHSNPRLEQKDQAQSTSSALESEFYGKAFDFLFGDKEYLDLYKETCELILIMTHIKDPELFVYSLLEFKPTLGDKICNLYRPKNYYDTTTKNRITLLYIAIKQYVLHDNKKIPAPSQYTAYYEALKLNIPLEDLCMSDAFNEEHYKLIETLNLMENIKKIGNSPNEEVQNFFYKLGYNPICS